MFSNNEESVISTSPLLCIQLRKTTNFGSVLKRRSVLLGQYNDEYSISSSSTSSATNTTCNGINTSFECNTQTADIIYDQLNALTKQDTTIYIQHDYIGRRQIRRKETLNYDQYDENEFTESADCDEYDIFQKDNDNEVPVSTFNKTLIEEHGDLNHVPEDETMMDVDETCREKMCEWSYRICDHFHTSREIVAIAFNYLDRFNDVTRCDRTAFKLASMTCLYIATKICHNKQLSVHTLVELSRNEFTYQNIILMEQVILSTLDYKMNPPTVQIFLHEYQHIIPIHHILVLVNNTNHMMMLLHSEYDQQRYITTKVMNDIFDRANYYSELVVYDYSLIIEQRQNIAISCLFNAIYDIVVLVQENDDTNDCENYYYEQQEKYEEFQIEFLNLLQTNISSLSIIIDMDHINEIQERLWYLYSCSADYHQNQYNGSRKYNAYTPGTNHKHSYTKHNKSNNSTTTTTAKTKHSVKPIKHMKSHPENHVATNHNKDDEFVTTTSGSPVCVIPIQDRRRVVSGMQPDQFSVRIF